MKVLIIGAGISGLTLAAAIKQKSPTITIALYERDKNAFARAQGYALGLKGDGGLSVLAELGLRDKVLSKDALKVTNFVFTDRAGKELLALPARDEKHLTYRVQRQHLKKVLLEAAADTPIHYGKTCAGYEQSTTGVTVTFADGTTASADYVIASDGVASVIRQQMVGDDKRYLGLCAIVGFAPIKIEHPLLDGGYFMALGDSGDSIFVYRQPGGVHFSYTLHAPDEPSLAALPQGELLEKVAEATKNWHSLITTIVSACDPNSLLVRGYYDKEPLGNVHDDRVWLIGDAAHPMCPFQGQGANMAMVDALKLADHLTAQGQKQTTAETDGVLNADIVKRGRKAVLESRHAAMQFHTTSGLKQANRNFGFKLANAMIHLFSKKSLN